MLLPLGAFHVVVLKTLKDAYVQAPLSDRLLGLRILTVRHVELRGTA